MDLLNFDLNGHGFPIRCFIILITGCQNLNLDLVSAFLKLLLDGYLTSILVDRDLLFAFYFDK